MSKCSHLPSQALCCWDIAGDKTVTLASTNQQDTAGLRELNLDCPLRMHVAINIAEGNPKKLPVH